MEVNLGDEAKDSITGFEGVVTGKSLYLHTATQYQISSKAMDNGRTIDPEWFYEGRVELVKTATSSRGFYSSFRTKESKCTF